jgi:dTDP-L-rhamnose 4-epimerase
MINSLHNKKILVTGGAGFIGCNLSQRLAAQASRYVAVDNLLAQVHPMQKRPKELHEAAELVVADVADKSDWSRLLSDFRPEVIVHLAAETGTGQSLTESSRHGRTNVVGLTELLDGLTVNEIVPEHFLLSSSRAVYGEGAWKAKDGKIFYPGQRTNFQLANSKWDFDGVSLPSKFAETKENPTSIYGATKLAQEHILASWAQAFGSKLSVLRFQNVYGPGQSPFNPYTGIVILFSKIAKEKKIIELYEDGMVTRDFVFIDDVVEAMVKALEKLPADGRRGLDIGSGDTTTLIQMAKLITDYHKAPPAVVCGKFRNGDVRHANCQVSEAQKDLDWSPAWDLKKGLTKLQEHYSETSLV